jgi:lipopolysaccharide export system permease protein
VLIYKYILKSHIAPFFLSFFIIIFVFTFQFIMKYIDNLIGKGLSWWVIFQLITLNLAWMVTLAGPMAVLVAVLMAFGSLSSTNEITIMRTAGMTTFRLILPILIFSAILCYLLILFNNNVLPEANHRTKVLMADIQRTKPTFVIEAGKFTDNIGGYNLLVKKTFPESNRIEGVFIIDNLNAAASNFLTAEYGDISFSGDQSTVILNLYKGEIHHLNKKDVYEDYRVIKFERHVVNIDAQGFGFNKSDVNALSRGDRELSADSMRGLVNSIKANYEAEKNRLNESIKKLALEFFNLTRPEKSDSLALARVYSYFQTLMNKYNGLKSQVLNQKQFDASTQKQIDVYLVEIYKKYSIPFACLVFVLVGAPMGIRVRKRGFGVAAGISLGFFLLYWASLIGGEKLADREFISPLAGMWTANIVLGLIGIYLVFFRDVVWLKTKSIPVTNLNAENQ